MAEHELDSRADAELIDRAVNGDRAAIEQLLWANYDSLAQHISLRLPAAIQGVVSAEDILQQTFVQAFRHIGGFAARSSAAFAVWLRTIADRVLQDVLRSSSRKKRGAGRTQLQRTPLWTAETATNLLDVVCRTDSTPSQSAARHEACQRIQVALAGLPDDYQDAVRLRFLEGKGLEEIANEMGKPTGAVRGLLDRAKKKLRAAMGRSSLYWEKK